MARVFNGSTQYLSRDSAVITGYPFTLACWFYSANTTGSYCAVGLTRRVPVSLRGYQADSLNIRGDVSGDPVEAYTFTTSGASITARTTGGFAANTWSHGCAVFAASNSRSVYINGGNKATVTTNGSPDTPDTTSVGVLRYSNGGASDNQKDAYFNGRLAYIGIWNAALTDDEVAALGQILNGVPCGVHPTMVRPDALVACWDLGGFAGDDDRDRCGAYDLTAYNSPTFDESPAVIYPDDVLLTGPGVSAGGGGGGSAGTGNLLLLGVGA